MMYILNLYIKRNDVASVVKLQLKYHFTSPNNLAFMFCISDEPGPAIIPLEAEKSPGRYISKLRLYNHRHNYTGLYMDMDVLHVYLWCPLSRLVKYCNKPGSYCLLMTFYPK